MTISDGSTASYYELPKGCTELQDLISHRNLNAQDGEIFRAIYRKGLASHSDELRDAKKVLFYATAEVKRLELARDIAAGYDQEGIDSVSFAKPSTAFAERIKAQEIESGDGWIKWEGSNRPIDSGIVVDVMYNGGNKDTAKAGAFDWDYDDSEFRVIAYRIHKDGE